ncbi:MAG: hypothetical protein ACI4XS_04615 [Bacillus sp. (in: firmicutes)]
MYTTIIQKLDITNLVFGILAVITLIWNENAYVEALIILVATLALVASKYRFHRLLIFLTYSCSILFLGIIFSKSTEDVVINGMKMPSNLIWITIIAVLVGAVCAFFKLGTNSMTAVLITFHILMFISAIKMSTSVPFIKALWSSNAQLYTVHTYYPILIASLLLGVFLEKYQIEIKKDRRND